MKKHPSSIFTDETTDGCAIVLCNTIAGGSGHLFDMLHGLKKRWWSEAAKLLDVGKGEDAARERRMLRRIVTADSPTENGEPAYLPIEAEKVFQAILHGTLYGAPNAPDTTPSAMGVPTPTVDALKQFRQNISD